LVTKLVIWESNNASDMNSLIFFLWNYAPQTLGNHIEDQVILVYFIKKQKACTMIWWRARIKIHIPTAQM
jgi:hypothetical protein